MKTPLPEELEAKMKKYRSGQAALPVDYILFHSELALDTLDQFHIVHSKWMADDGWMDGMRVVHAVIETKDETLKKIKWNDTNQGWMERGDGGIGWIIFDN